MKKILPTVLLLLTLLGCNSISTDQAGGDKDLWRELSVISQNVSYKENFGRQDGGFIPYGNMKEYFDEIDRVKSLMEKQGLLEEKAYTLSSDFLLNHYETSDLSAFLRTLNEKYGYYITLDLLDFRKVFYMSLDETKEETFSFTAYLPKEDMVRFSEIIEAL